MNLVHEAMARESSEDGKKPKKDSKKNAKKNARTRFIATLVTWILLNLIWLQASQAVAVNEINKHGRTDFDGHYVLDVPNMLKMDREIPVDLSCDFFFRICLIFKKNLLYQSIKYSDQNLNISIKTSTRTATKI